MGFPDIPFSEALREDCLVLVVGNFAALDSVRIVPNYLRRVAYYRRVHMGDAMSGHCAECGNTQCLCREIAAWALALKQAEEKGHASLATALREDGFDPKVDFSDFVDSPVPPRHPDTVGWSQELFDRAVSHAVNTAVNGISQEVQTAMLLGGVSEGVFASVVQSIESYRLP